MLQACGGPYLGKKPFAAERGAEIWMQYFDGDIAVVLDVVRETQSWKELADSHVCRLGDHPAQRAAMFARVNPVILGLRQEKGSRATILQPCARLTERVCGNERICSGDHAPKMFRGVFNAIGTGEAEIQRVLRRQRATSELLKVRRWIESGILLDDGLHQRRKREDIHICEDRVDQIARLPTNCQRHQLVDRQVDWLEHDSAT